VGVRAVDGVGVRAIERERDYAALYREVGPQLWRAILVYTGGRREVADDAVGEAFARAMESDGVIRRRSRGCIAPPSGSPPASCGARTPHSPRPRSGSTTLRPTI
jgi:hypothetical protein